MFNSENKLVPILPNINEINNKKYFSSIPTITTSSIIGTGGYGTVLKCIDKNGIEMAVKKICTNDDGIPCLMEISIMSTINHPFINKAYEIHCEPNMIYIIQELAISDLRAYRNIHNPCIDQIIKWFYQISSGLHHLHELDIIHGDIKSSNILIYKDLTIKLSDFTLSTKNNWSNNYFACTSSHRPLEILLNQGRWDKSIDIWSLGCTFFEIIYGYNLFSCQKTDQCINSIIDWSNNELVKANSNLKLKDIIYHSYIIPNPFIIDDSIKGKLNLLILSLLKINYKDRPSISSILNNSLFDIYKIEQINLEIEGQIYNNLSKRTQSRIKNIIMKFTENNIVIDHSLYLYSRLNKLYSISDDLKIETCIWISHKLIYKYSLPQNKLNYPYYKISETERIICYHLGFKIHSPFN